jgi:catechol 2,3-dioxygenase-like lactoylglutathione lyase family enzyme
MLESGELVAFVATRDLARSARFYGELLGLRLIETTEFANVYEVGGTQLRVTLVEALAGAPYTVLGWRVDDVSATIRSLQDAGVRFERYEGMEQDDEGVWEAPGGSLIAWFRDPDGNTLSLQQPTAQR